MKTLIHLPIEPFEGRYSKDWLEWYKNASIDSGFDEKFFLSENQYDKITHGSFLDVFGTCIYKVDQMFGLLNWIQEEHRNGRNWSETIFFFHDLWNPEVIHLKYIRDALKLPFKIAGMLHAGTYDPYDFLTQSGMETWGSYIEHGMWKETDAIFVATEFHRRLLCSSRYLNPDKVYISGFPIYPRHKIYEVHNKDRSVVFPHRLNEEKNPHLFERLKEEIEKMDPHGVSFVRTYDLKQTKDEYYKELTKHRVAVSFSNQETWGIAMQECVFAGCLPLVPDKLSYSEMYLPEFKYQYGENVAIRCMELLDHYDDFQSLWTEQYNKLKVAGELAIRKQKMVMHAL